MALYLYSELLQTYLYASKFLMFFSTAVVCPTSVAYLRSCTCKSSSSDFLGFSVVDDKKVPNFGIAVDCPQ